MRKIIFGLVVLLSAGLMLPASLFAQTSTNSSSGGKCGVNTFSINDDCGAGAYKTMYVQCYDGYEEKQGGETSCKSSPQWQEYAQQTCAKRCSNAAATQTAPSKTISVPNAQVMPVSPAAGYEKLAPISGGTVSICSINNDLMAQYDALISQLQDAQKSGDGNREKITTDKITELKQYISGDKSKCGVIPPSSAATAPGIGSAMPASEPVKINRCAEAENWGQKISYYEKLKNLSDSDLQKEAAKSRTEINNIISELTDGLAKVKAQCSIQASGGNNASTAAKISDPVKPVAIQSAQEISDYYKAKIENIAAGNDSSTAQIQKLQELKQNKDLMVGELIKNRNEIESSDLNTLSKEVKVSKNEITVDNVAVQTTGTKILLNVGNSPISVEPDKNGVVINDKNLQIQTDNVSINNNVLTIGGNEVKISASKVAQNLNIAPTSVQLTEQNSKPVYKMQVNEPRKLFGFIPSNIPTTQIADAENGNLLSQSRPWYYFLTTK